MFIGDLKGTGKILKTGKDQFGVFGRIVRDR